MSLSPIWRVVLARFVSRTGGEAAFFVGIWGKLAYEYDGTAAEVATVMAGVGVAALIGSVVAGAVVDRFGPKAVLVASELLFVPSVLSVLLVDNVPQFAAAVFLVGLTGAPTFTAIAAIPPFITDDEEQLMRMNSLIEGAGMAALIVGSAAGAAISVVVGLDAVFVFDALTSVIGVLIVLTVTIAAPERADDRSRSGLAEIAHGLRFSWNHRRLRFYLGMGASLWVIFGLFTALEPLFYRDVLEVGPETLGWVNSVFGVGLVAGTVLAARLGVRLRSARVVVGLLALNALGCLLYIGTSLLWVVVTGAVVWGIIIGTFAPVVRTMLHLNSPADLVGRVMGTSQALSEVAHLGPLVVAPLLAAILGVQAALAASAAVLGVIALASWRTAAGLDETRTFDVTVDEPYAPIPDAPPHTSADRLG